MGYISQYEPLLKNRTMTENFNQADFNKAMNYIFSNVEDDMQEQVADCTFDWDAWDLESKEVPCKYRKGGIASLLYMLCDYDWIVVEDSGEVSVSRSNHPDIAERMAPYTTPEMGLRVVENLYNPIRRTFQ